MGRVWFDQDAIYLRKLEAERIELVGPTCEYYSLNRGRNVDPLYNEPDNDPLYGGSDPIGTPQTDSTSWNYYPDINKTPPDDLLQMPCIIEYQEMDNRQPSVRDEGFIAEYDAIMHLARDHWECTIEDTDIDGRLPKEGDVIYVFEEWFDVIKVGKGGNILDSPNYVGFKFELRKTTVFTPNRKV